MSPLSGTVGAFLAEEWDRFMGGLEGLNPQQRAAAKERARTELQAYGGDATVTMPGWDDVIHITPRLKLDEERVTAHFKARREGKPSPLNAAEAAELQRRRDRRDAMATTAQPDYARAFGSILTAIDNVQDMTTTIVVAGRLALWPTVSGLNALGGILPATIAPAATGGARLLGRFVPVLGWVLVAGDVLKLMQQLGLLALPGYALYCAGALEAAGAALPAAVWGRRAKTLAEGLASFNPFSRTARAARKMRLARRLPTVPEIIEVGQTTDSLWGRGVSFGGLVGAAMESAYAATRAARGEPTTGATSAAGHSISRALEGRFGGYTLPELAEKENAAAVLKGLPFFTNTQDVFTPDEHAMAVAAAIAAVDVIREDVDLLDLDVLADLLPSMQLRAPEPERDPDSTTPARRGADDGAGWPGPWEVKRHVVTPQEYIEWTMREAPRNLGAFLTTHQDEMLAAWYGAAVGTLTERLMLLLERDENYITYELTGPHRVLVALANASRVVNTRAGEEGVVAFVGAAEERMRAEDRTLLTGAELDALAATAGVELLRLRPP